MQLNGADILAKQYRSKLVRNGLQVRKGDFKKVIFEFLKNGFSHFTPPTTFLPYKMESEVMYLMTGDMWTLKNPQIILPGKP
jgi:hypothetical protein